MTATTDETALLRAILAHPDEDVPRLIQPIEGLEISVDLDTMKRAEQVLLAPAGSNQSAPPQSRGHVMAEGQSTTVAPTVEYRVVAGHPGYRVGTDGSVWTCLRRVCRGPGRVHSVLGDVWKQMRPTLDPKGRPKIGLRKDGRSVPFAVCRLVIEAFVGPRPPGMDCCHNDGNPANNALANLRWDSRRANCQDAVRHGTTTRGEKNRHCRLTEAHIPLIFAARQRGDSNAKIARDFGINYRTVGYILRRKLWRHVQIPEPLPS